MSSPGSISSMERSYSSSSLLLSPSQQRKASPGRMLQKSFGRQPIRLVIPPVSPVASAPVVVQPVDSLKVPLSGDDSEFERGFRQEITQDLSMVDDGIAHGLENTKLRTEIEIMRQELQDLRDASSKNDEAWQRENGRLKDQLAAINKRDAEQQQQLRVLDDQLSLCRQELLELQEHQLKVEDAHARPPVEEAGSSGLGRERDLLKLVVQLVGASNVRAVLRENPSTSPSQLREALVRIRCPQCQGHRSSSPPAKTAAIGHESIHKMLFGTSSRPLSPTAIRFDSRGPRSPHK